MRPLVPGEAHGERDREDGERGGDPAHATTSRDAEQRGAALRVERAAGAAEHARGLGGEVPAAAQHLGDRGVGDRAALAEQDRALGPGGGELGVVGRHQDGGAAGGQLAQPGCQPGAVAAVHPARGLVEADGDGRLAACQHQLEREPLPLAARHVARMAIGELARLRQVVADAVVQEVVARVLEQQGHPAGAHDLAARGLEQAGEHPQQRRLAGPVAPQQRHRLARREREVDAAQDRRPGRDLVPRAPQRDDRAPARRPRGAAT